MISMQPGMPSLIKTTTTTPVVKSSVNKTILRRSIIFFTLGICCWLTKDNKILCGFFVTSILLSTSRMLTKTCKLLFKNSSCQCFHIVHSKAHDPGEGLKKIKTFPSFEWTQGKDCSLLAAFLKAVFCSFRSNKK